MTPSRALWSIFGPALLGSVLIPCHAIDAGAQDLGAGDGDGSRHLSQFTHLAWRSRDGLPQNSVRGIGQTPDGHLWIATLGGVARFDGTEFTLFDSSHDPELPTNRFTALGVAPDGTVWLGAEDGRVVTMGHGEFNVVWDAQEPILDLAFMPDGAPLLSTGREVVRWDARAQRMHRELGHGGAVAVASDGAVWVAGPGGVYRRSARSTRRVADGSMEMAVSAAEGGRMWVVGDRVELFEADGRVSQSTTLPGSSMGGDALVDRDGALWVGTTSGQLFRFRGASVDSLYNPRPNHLFVQALFQDLDGSVWFGKEGDGLFQLSRGLVRPLGPPEGLGRSPSSFLEADDGSILVGEDCGFLWRIRGDEVELATDVSPDLGCYRSLALDSAGTLWVGEGTDLRRIHRDGSVSIEDLGANIWAIAEDAGRTMWLAVGRRLLRVEGDRFVPVDLGVERPRVGRIVSDRVRHGLWVTVDGRGLAFLAGDEVTWYGSESGLVSPDVRDVWLDPDGVVWAATYGGGVARIGPNGVGVTDRSDGLCDNFVSRIVGSGDELWFNSNAGPFSIPRRSLEMQLNGGAVLACTPLGPEDGVRQQEGRWGGHVGGDGRIWFPNVAGVSVISPGHPRGPAPRSLHVRSVVLGDSSVAGPTAMTLPTGIRAIEIQYSAVALLQPSQTRLEYRLEDHDDGWVRAGARRSAFYTNLHPGRHEFRLRGFNAAGSESQAPAILLIEVPPFFYETWWFALASVLGVVSLLGVANRWTLRHLTARNLRLEAEITERQRLEREILRVSTEERNRIGQELHDGLGQQLAGISYAASALRTSLAREGSESAAVVDSLQALIKSTQDQSRYIARGLLTLAQGGEGLTERLHDLAERAEARFGLECRVVVDSEAAQLDAEETVAGLYQIAREAVTNTARHAEARSVSIRLRREAAQWVLSIEDDGLGMDENAASKEHLGLLIMRDRANRMGGTLEISARDDGGTCIECVVPVEPTD